MLVKIATPPSLETGILWILRSFGRSTKPSFFEYAITIGTMNIPKIKDISAPIICTCACPNVVRIVLSPIYFSYIMGTFDKVLKSVLSSSLKHFHH